MKKYRDHIIALLIFLADVVWLNLIVIGTIYLRFYATWLPFPQALPPWSALRPFWILLHLTLFPALLGFGAYRSPRAWRLNEAFYAVGRAVLLVALPTTTLLLFALRFGAGESELVSTTSRFVAFVVWTGALVGLTVIRLATGRGQLALYSRGLGVRRSLILGEVAPAQALAERMRLHPWLGEEIVGYVGEGSGRAWLGQAEELPDLIAAHQIDVIWLAPSPKQHVPPHLFTPAGAAILWRMCAEDFSQASLKELPPEHRANFFDRVQHHLSLPTYRLAMIGSRGVPANYGGVETYVEEVGSFLAQNGVEVTVYCHKKYVAARGFHRGMRLRFVPTVPSKHLETIIHTTAATADALMRGTDVFHFHALGPTTIAWLPRLLGGKVVTTVQGLDWQRGKWGRIARQYLKMSEWATRHFPQVTIVVSQILHDHYLERGKHTIYIPNGFEPPQRRSPDLIKKELGLDKDEYVLFVGRLTPEKGCHTLIEAFKQVKTEKHLVMAGPSTRDGHYYQQLMSQVNGDCRIQFPGFVKGKLLQELFTNAYLVVHPSEMEGLSIALLEALSYGNCVLLSDAPENLETARSLGCTFRVGDAADLARKLQNLLSQPSLVQDVRGMVATGFAQFNGWDVVAQETANIYQSLFQSSFSYTKRGAVNSPTQTR